MSKEYDYSDVEAFFNEYTLDRSAPAAGRGNAPAAQTSTAPKRTAESSPAVRETEYAAQAHRAAPAPAIRGTSAAASDNRPRPSRVQSADTAKSEVDYRVSSRPKKSVYSDSPKKRAGSPLIGWLILVVIALLSIWWTAVHVHPDSSTAATVSEEKLQTTDLISSFNRYISNSYSNALSNVAYIPKVYTIPEEDLVAPKPDQAKFGETDDPAVVQQVIDSAAELLEGQTLSWSPDIDFMEGTKIKYYCDETILAIAWKEGINGSACTFAEIKIADGSQLRRAIADNTYGSSVQYLASDMAKNVNAVIAINGDFYTYRTQGITVYQRKLYRHSPKKLDTAFFTASGDMLFAEKGTLLDENEARRFIIDNDIVFSVAFGPIIVRDGVQQHIDEYPVGEIDNIYSRAAIGQLNARHYMLMTLGEEGRYQTRAQLNTAAGYFAAKGVVNAYCLDGGQTAVMIFNGEPFNRVDWDAERTMSDIIYFATAIPEEEGSQ